MPISTRHRGSSRPRKSAKAAKDGGVTPARIRAVWISFIGAMTLVGGLLLVLDGRPVPRVDGLSLSPLAATTWGSDPAVDPILATRRPLDQHRWQAIVIHHSGSTVGTPASIEADHQARNLRGLGHHFILGNGNGMEDGQIHIGYRWLDQLPGAHAAGPNGDAYNLHAISICLVGDGNRRPFTPAQIQRLSSLVETLRRQFNIPADHVVLHSDIAAVDDPGRLFPAHVLRTSVAAAATAP
jgi:hypothetical protein